MKTSQFKPGKKVYLKGTDEVLYMYSFTTDDKFVICSIDPLGYKGKHSVLYTELSGKPSKRSVEHTKRYRHAENVLKVFTDVEDLDILLMSNPTYKDTIIELIRPYIGNSEFWNFVLHTAADNPKLQESIKQLLTSSKL